MDKRATRKWISDSDALSFMLQHRLEPYDQVLKSPAKAEKELEKDAIPDMTKYVKSVSSGHTIASASDKRKAVVTGEAVLSQTAAARLKAML